MVFIKTDLVAKGISQDNIPENWVGRWANRSLRMGTMTVSESSPTNSPRRVVPYIFTDTFGSVFSRTTGFVLKMIIFSYMAYASVSESVRTRGMG